MGDKPYTKAVKQDILVKFSKVQQSSNNFSKKRWLYQLKSEDKANSTYISKSFSTKSYAFVDEIVAFMGCFLGIKIDYIDVWMIKIVIKTNQIDKDAFFQK